MAEAELTTTARPYARAAFSYALDQAEGLSNWSRMLGLLAAAISQPLVQKALDNPVLTTEDETGLLLKLMGDDLDSEANNFVGLLAEYGRLGLLPTISEMFELLKANHEKTMEVQITSAYDVTEQEKSELKTALHRMLQRDISLETEVDQSLIGGVVVKAEDTVIDNSVRGKLAKLSHALN
jgi:F-type H+-transporting ATPase subunit delta